MKEYSKKNCSLLVVGNKDEGKQGNMEATK